jgi:hypothetical protein
MSFLGGVGDGPTSLVTPTMLWVLISLIVVVGIGIGIGKFVAVGKARAEVPRAPNEAARALNEPVHVLPMPCRLNGHSYKEYDTGWRCATCGNHVPRRDGELYGLVEDGRHERRRQAR